MTARDNTLVTIVNETLARTMWPGENPLGKRFACCEVGPKGRMDPVWHEVVGVVADVRAWGLDRQIDTPRVYRLEQLPRALQAVTKQPRWVGAKNCVLAFGTGFG